MSREQRNPFDYPFWTTEMQNKFIDIANGYSILWEKIKTLPDSRLRSMVRQDLEKSLEVLRKAINFHGIDEG